MRFEKNYSLSESNMLNDTTTIFREELSAREQILWSSQPIQGLMLRSSDVFMIPFSLLWGGFAIFWESMVVYVGAPFFFMLWGIPFILFGLYMIVGRFFVDAKQREKTYYALTSERVIILSGLFRNNIRSMRLKNLSDINISVKSNGSGTITFGASHQVDRWYSWFASPGVGRYTPPEFEMIDKAKQVYDLFRKIQREL